MSRKHEVDDCPCIVDECSKGDTCRKWCMVDLCTKFHKIICKVHKASDWEEMKNALGKLDDFEDDLENAYEWLDNHKGDKQKSCSSRKKIGKLQKVCERLRDAYEDEFYGESSDDDDIWIDMEFDNHQMGIPRMEEKEVKKEVSQRSLEKPLDTPTLPLEYAHGVEEEHPLLEITPVMSLVDENCYPIDVEEKHVNITMMLFMWKRRG